jgi:predicted metalloprotease with PDZ domain
MLAGLWIDFLLPNWTPGSYLIRDFARHLGPITAKDPATGASLVCERLSKNRFRVVLPAALPAVPPAQPPTGRPALRLEYWVYAHELSVRTADVTPEHAYWNHACVLLWPVEHPRARARIAIRLPAGWDFASALPTIADRGGEIVLEADGLDHAVDSPCIAGALQRLELHALGVRHTVVLEGLAGLAVPKDFAADLTRLIECAANVFGGRLPYDHYTFLCLFADNGHGGLEHSHSTTLLSGRTALHRASAYRDFLSLAIHEVFHAWNVKRMRPAELWTYDYERENYTRLLWLVEGFTAYYDDLLCRRAGIYSVSEYLAVLAKNLTNLWSGVGRQRMSLSDSSFDAWIRLYRPDENTRNSSQNYYGNGAIVALVLDLTIRKTTGGERCLDDAMRALYRSTFEAGRGYRRQDIAKCLAEAARTEIGPLLDSLVDGPLDPDVSALLADFGVSVAHKDRDKPYLGITFETDRLVVTAVNENGPAFESGIAPGDEVLAIAGLRVTSENWAETAEAALAIGRPLAVLTSSRGVIRERSLVPAQHPLGNVTVELDAGATPARVALREGWLRARSN